MGEMDEDRVYDDRREETVAYVASGQGVATVRVSSDRVGRFSLARRCQARDVAAAGERVYVATDEDVLARDEAVSADPAFEELSFGPAVAVGTGPDGVVFVADEKGRIFRYEDGSERGGDGDEGDGYGEWDILGTVGEVRAIERDLVAASDGVYRIAGDDVVGVGLADVRDVAADGVPLAATDDGLYRLGNGWLCEREGAFRVVAAERDRAHAATADRLFERASGEDSDGGDGEDSDGGDSDDSGEWTPVEVPVAASVAGVAYGECVYAVTGDGTFLVEAPAERTADGTGGWRQRALGLPDVAGLAVV